jgi:hypothetical protein
VQAAAVAAVVATAQQPAATAATQAKAAPAFSTATASLDHPAGYSAESRMTSIKLGFVMAALLAFGGAYFTGANQLVSTALFGFGTALVGLVLPEAGAKRS